ncbi:lytic transglycosylase domain-containing protein [bacterium BFN5]|nr:lytic transglycosylase domain-containing protein [bacterium BFN5]
MIGINKVLERITSIEQRFAPQNAKNSNFSKILDSEMKRNLATSSASKNAPPEEIANLINSSAKKYGVDPKLVTAVAMSESGFDPNALSSVGAVGIMQLMPATADSLGVRDIHNPRENIEGGVKYLKELLTTFNGDVAKAVAAYNAGPQAVINYNGVPPYNETQAYVGKVLQQYRDNQ